MKKLRKKLKSRRGFTLAETLIVVLILLMVSAVVAEGIPVAVNALDKVVETSNAQLLLSTTMTALRDELSMARDVQVGTTDKTVTYTNSMGLKSQLLRGEGTKSIQLKQSTAYGGDLSAQESQPLLSDATASKSRRTGQPALYTTYTDVAFDDTTGIVTFTGLEVKRVDNNNTAAAIDGVYSVRIVGYEP